MNWTPSEMGKKGGKKSRRTLTQEQARKMVETREAKKAEKSQKHLKTGE